MSARYQRVGEWFGVLTGTGLATLLTINARRKAAEKEGRAAQETE